MVAQSRGRDAQGSPSPAIAETASSGPPVPCPTYFEAGPESCAPGGYEDVPFEIPANGNGVDNGFATVAIEWVDSNLDFDLEIYRDANGDGDLDDVNEDNEPENEPVASSAQGGTSLESTEDGPGSRARRLLRPRDQLRRRRHV